MNLTDEQIKAILDGAPDGAFYFDGDFYTDVNGFIWCSQSLEWYECGHFCCGTPLTLYQEILTLRQEIERLKISHGDVVDAFNLGTDVDLQQAVGRMIDHKEQDDE